MSPTATPPITCACHLPNHLWCAPCSAANRAAAAPHPSHPPSSPAKQTLSHTNANTPMSPTPLIHTASEWHAHHHLVNKHEFVIIPPAKKVHFTPTALSEGKSKLGRAERRTRRPSNAEVRARRLAGSLLDTSGKKLAWEDFCRSDEEWEWEGGGEEENDGSDRKTNGEEEEEGEQLAVGEQLSDEAAAGQREKRAGEDEV